MAKPKNTTRKTYVCRGRLSGDSAHAVLYQRRVSAGMLRDAAITELVSNNQPKPLDDAESQKLTTHVARQLGMSRGKLNSRCRIAIVGKAVTGWNNHVKHDAGLPTLYNGTPVRTIESYAHSYRIQNPWVMLHKRENLQCHASLHIPGFPTIALTCARELPDDQPTYASVSVDGRKVTVQLVYPIAQQPLSPVTDSSLRNVLGIDLGGTDIIATAAGISFKGIRQDKLEAKIKKAQQVCAAVRGKAIRNKHAGFWPVLDDNNRQVINKKGYPKRHLVWFVWRPSPDNKEKLLPYVTNEPHKEYRKARQCLSKLLKKRARQRKSYRHQVSAAIVKYCDANNIQLIAVEKLRIKNMTKSAKGTVEKPGHRVAQKRGLNRRILEQGWAELIEMIAYKARFRGIRLAKIDPAGTSQTCSECGHRDNKSRVKKLFCCTLCGYQADADRNAAVNIGDRGARYFGKQFGITLDDVRQQRVRPLLPDAV